MPLIVFESGSLKPEVKAELIQKLTDISVAVTGIPKHLFLVSIREWPDQNVAVGGVTAEELKLQLAEAKNEH
jgi:4-oxalocrotonate tautomerase